MDYSVKISMIVGGENNKPYRVSKLFGFRQIINNNAKIFGETPYLWPS